MNNETTLKDARFVSLYKELHPRARQFALLLTKSEADADDIAQNVFLELWMKPEVWENGSDVGGYVYTATRNRIFSLFKRRNLQNSLMEPRDLPQELAEEIYDNRADALEKLYYDDVRLLVEMALTRMPEKRRRIFEMSRFEEMSNKEIAEKLDIPLRTVEDCIYRTLKELRELLSIVVLLNLFRSFAC